MLTVPIVILHSLAMFNGLQLSAQPSQEGEPKPAQPMEAPRC